MQSTRRWERNSPFRSASGEEGFSLLEVAITLALLTTVALSSVLVAVPVSRQTRLTREVETANLEVRKVLEEVQAAPFNNITTRYPPNTEVLISNLNNGKVIVTYVNPSADPLRIQVNLTWDSPDVGPMSRTFLTARTK